MRNKRVIAGLILAVVVVAIMITILGTIIRDSKDSNAVETIEPVYLEEVKDTTPHVQTDVDKSVEVEEDPVNVDIIEYLEIDEVEDVLIEDTGETEIDPYTLEMLAIVIYQEAGADKISDETRLMVGNVVLNRIADSRYPNTMEEVLTQYLQYGMLWSTGIIWPARSTSPGEQHAVERAYDCARRLLEGERVLDEDVVFQAEFFQGTECVAYADGLYFCR